MPGRGPGRQWSCPAKRGPGSLRVRPAANGLAASPLGTNPTHASGLVDASGASAGARSHGSPSLATASKNTEHMMGAGPEQIDTRSLNRPQTPQEAHRCCFEQAIGTDVKSAFWIGGSLGAPMGALQYELALFPIGTKLWLQQLESYRTFPPLQAPSSYNLDAVIAAIKAANQNHPSD